MALPASPAAAPLRRERGAPRCAKQATWVARPPLRAQRWVACHRREPSRQTGAPRPPARGRGAFTYNGVAAEAAIAAAPPRPGPRVPPTAAATSCPTTATSGPPTSGTTTRCRAARPARGTTTAPAESAYRPGPRGRPAAREAQARAIRRGGSGPGRRDPAGWLGSGPARSGGANQPSGEADGVGAGGAGDDGGSLGLGVAEGTELDGGPGVVAVELGIALAVALARDGCRDWLRRDGVGRLSGRLSRASSGPVWRVVGGRDARMALGPARLTSLSGSAGAAAAAADDVCTRAGTLTAARDVPAWVAPAGPLTNWITTGP